MGGRGGSLLVAAGLVLACAGPAPAPSPACPEGPHLRLIYAVDPPGEPVQVVRALQERLDAFGEGCVGVVDGQVVVDLAGADASVATALAAPAQLRIAAVAETGVLLVWYDAVLATVRDAPGVARMPYQGAASAVIQQGDAAELRAGVAAIPTPEGHEVVWQRVDTDGALWWQPVLIKLHGAIGGDRVTDAVAITDPIGHPAVQLVLDEQGKRDLFALTGSMYGRPLAFVLDGEVLLSPVVREAISGGRAQITMSDPDAAARLAASLRSGALPAPVRLLSVDVVSEASGPREHPHASGGEGADRP